VKFVLFREISTFPSFRAVVLPLCGRVTAYKHSSFEEVSFVSCISVSKYAGKSRGRGVCSVLEVATL